MAPTSSPENKFKLDQVQLPEYSAPDFTQKQEPEKICRLIRTCVAGGEKYRAQYATNWTDYLRKYVGDFYRNKQRFGYECRPPKFLEKVELQVTLLTSNPEKSYVIRVDQSDSADDVKPDIFTRLIKDAKDKGKYDEKEQFVLQLGGTYGPGIMRTFFDRKSDNGRGYPNFKTIDAQNFIVSPGAKTLEESQFICVKEPVATAELKRLYPAFAERIKEDPGMSLRDLYGQDVMENSGYSVADSTTGAVAYLQQLKQAHGTGRAGDQTMLYDFFYRDPRWVSLKNEKELRDWIQAKPGFGNAYFKECAFNDYVKRGFPQQVPLYPHGRIIYMCNDIVLEDHPNPYPWHLYDVWHNSPVWYSFWSKGLIELSSDALSNYHLITSTLSANAIFRNMPPFIGTATMDNNRFKKIQPSAYIKINKGDTIEPMNIPAVPVQEMKMLLDLREQEADGGSGVSNLLSGYRPPGVFAGSFYQNLQDAAYKPMTRKGQRLTGFRSSVADKVLWMFQNLVEDARIIPFVNDDEQQELLKINEPHVDSTNPDVVRIYKTNNIGIGKFKYLIEPGTGLPYNMITRVQQAMEQAKMMLQCGYEMPAMKLMLEANALPGYKKVLKELEALYQQKMMAHQTQLQQSQVMTAQQRLDNLNSEMAKLDAKIKVAQITAQSTALTTAQDDSTSPEETMQIFQSTLARMVQEGISPQEIHGLLDEVSGGMGAPSSPIAPGPEGMPLNQGTPEDSNLGDLTPRIPSEINPPMPPMAQNGPQQMGSAPQPLPM